MKLKRTILIFALLMTLQIAKSQEIIVDSLLKHLESKLIGNRDELITINDLLAPKYITIDTTYLVRKIQPKLDEVSLLLTQIASFHNDTILSRLVQIREEYILTLKKEWEYLYLRSFSDRPIVLEKLLILYNRLV